MKRIITILSAILLPLAALADDGMWLPSLISQRIADMQAKGFKLSAEDVYSVNQASLKDAVVLFGRGCTGELISAEGLLITNHHCGYGQIQSHSSVEHDYLKDGFWAMNRAEELPCPGLSVSFLERMDDVTGQVLNGYDKSMNEAQRDSLVKANSKAIIAEATKDGNGLRASVEALYYGNQYFIFVYREYTDVRLVGAPPSSIGKFGGDTDNWMWPRHTGDFSMFRVYAGKDNNPASYSEANVPYSPKKFFKISTAGVKEGDFTFIYGFPGSTREYIHSSAVNYITEISDPARIEIRTQRLAIQKKYMSSSQKIRIQYSSKNASVANAWKKWQGEVKGVRKNHVIDAKKDYEARFEAWAKGTEYEGITGRIEALQKEADKWNFARDIFTETAYAVELSKKNLDLKDYCMDIDRESFVVEMEAFCKYVPEDIQPAWFKEQLAKWGGVEAWSHEMFKDVESPAMAQEFGAKMMEWYQKELSPKIKEYALQIDLLNRDYMRGQMAFETERDFFPDANLTLRVAYGHVCGYSPADGTYYRPVSTLKGVMEKDNPEIFDYNIPQVLRDIYARGGFENVPVCFLANNHTTGGNSGSPVINADGNLIGLNFDRVWEGTMSDISFDPEICRNISLDINYALFIIKEIGHADHLINEMVLVR
ncbi:MAG: S46 family peptidase [Bacteroidales bacterium]|nr:S46 family peptidase [Bacteroidales bacterium]